MPLQPKRDIGQIFRERKLIDEALNAAAREAARLHKRLGQPLVVWRNGQIVLIPPEEIEDGEEPLSSTDHK